ncbi:hypothetical protein [Streptomyces clavuligerus]|uniref:Uncharacterized protein n=1 Tax=Streptomyces clavuligerus TaxID=1901 RepID=B5GLR5_STRCL|nr:hypothetical protein [Streptomyces clavuligerus]EDY47261.1 conserved hypothetical protein [Streptomyces clavuligerus]EFG04924.1 Hypothetical protein SCLAV_p1442 [Streptomyces clavuligerus]MBY6306639.1 hypothetical protein [Streptomyces clavuligerus]QCS10753.1 hypothetical protein CRV15_35125 [Streptomyces clavuligerus]QPJ97211.1 hypothetical protein GE265_29355 [Streptomyces clavuligerus]
MRSVLAHIAQHSERLARHPFLLGLADSLRDPVRRMDFAPCFAPFVMGFADINTLGLRDESADDDPLQHLINEHTREDDHHWPLYLDDLATLGLTTPADPVDTIRALWSEETLRTREAVYTIMDLARTTTPPLRLALVEAVEATGAVLWDAFLKAAADYTAATGRPLRYFGGEHAALETGHAMGADDIDRELSGIDLGADRPRALTITDTVFDRISGMLDDFHAYGGPSRTER